MIVAMLDGKLARAIAGSRAACPECKNSVYARIPDGAIRHWAHMPLADGELRDCSNDAGEMTEWHREWQDLRSDPECIEVFRDGFRADAINEADTVVEFQHSSISPAKIAAREEHWGRGVWVLDGTDADGERRVAVLRKPGQPPEDPWCRYRWPHSPRLLFQAKWPCWIDLGTRGLVQVYSAEANGGNGWQVTRDWFIAEVLNGQRAILRRHDPQRTVDRLRGPRRAKGVARPEVEEDLTALVRHCEREQAEPDNEPPGVIYYEACSRCSAALLAPISQRRGYCEACRIKAGEKSAPTWAAEHNDPTNRRVA